jgi:hypothetical protein
MPIPNNITKQHIEKVLEQFKSELKCINLANNDNRYRFALEYNNELYCPKEVIRKAGELIGEYEFEFSGGYGNRNHNANTFLENLGFRIIPLGDKMEKEKLKKLLKNFIEDSLNINLYNTTEINQKYSNKTYKDLLIRTSFGLGVPSSVSWIAFLGFNQKVSEGIYPVILFDREECLVLAYGISETREASRNWPMDIITNYKKIKDSYCNECNLVKIKKKYPNSYLKKCYKVKNNFLKDEELDDLIEKLDEIIENYKNIFNPILPETNNETINKKGNYMILNNLKLEEYIINSFYNTLKTKGFVILAGISGSGKTKIFEEFVKCFELKKLEKKEKWLVIKDTQEKISPLKKEQIIFNKKVITIDKIISSINSILNEDTNSSIVLKLSNYYIELVPIIEALKNKVDFITAQQIHPYLATYIISLFGFEVIERNEIEKLGLKKLNKEIDIIEISYTFKNNLFYSIRPDFRDTKSLLGFYNPLKNEYHYDPEIHDPEKVFAFLCYRGVHYAKWVYLNIFPNDGWELKNPREEG